MPPPYVANSRPSIDRSTLLAPTAVHSSWIMVGALHTGESGLTVKASMRTFDRPTVVAGVPESVVVGPRVVGEAAVVLVAAAVVVVVAVGAVLTGRPARWPLLQAPTARIASAATIARARTGARRAMAGGYVDTAPYPGQECLASSIPRRAT